MKKLILALTVVLIAFAILVSPVLALPFIPPPPKPPEYEVYLQILDQQVTNINMKQESYYTYECKIETCSVSGKGVLIISSSTYWNGPDVEQIRFAGLMVVFGEVYGTLNKGDVFFAIAIK